MSLVWCADCRLHGHLDDENVMSASNVVPASNRYFCRRKSRNKCIYLSSFFPKIKRFYRTFWNTTLWGSNVMLFYQWQLLPRNGKNRHEWWVPVDRGSRANVSGTENRRCPRTDSADSKKNLPVSPKVAPVQVGPDLLAPLHKSNLTLAGRKIQK